jgi:predicted nucleic acid-binding protein
VRLAFDADVLIYAGQMGHPARPDLIRLLQEPRLEGKRFGSALLLPELLSKPTRLKLQPEVDALTDMLATLELQAVDVSVAALAVQFGATYKLKTADAIHLASAVRVGADAFVTNNARDFDPAVIVELQILFPHDLTAIVV